MSTLDIIDIDRLSKELGVSKSKIHYYTKLGLLTPLTTAGKAFVYEKQRAIDTYNLIQKKQEEGGITLLQLVEEFKTQNK